MMPCAIFQKGMACERFYKLLSPLLNDFIRFSGSLTFLSSASFLLTNPYLIEMLTLTKTYSGCIYKYMSCGAASSAKNTFRFHHDQIMTIFIVYHEISWFLLDI